MKLLEHILITNSKYYKDHNVDTYFMFCPVFPLLLIYYGLAIACNPNVLVCVVFKSLTLLFMHKSPEKKGFHERLNEFVLFIIERWTLVLKYHLRQVLNYKTFLTIVLCLCILKLDHTMLLDFGELCLTSKCAYVSVLHHLVCTFQLNVSCGKCSYHCCIHDILITSPLLYPVFLCKKPCSVI
jgi:hypothetical protein